LGLGGAGVAMMETCVSELLGVIVSVPVSRASLSGPSN